MQNDQGNKQPQDNMSGSFEFSYNDEEAVPTERATSASQKISWTASEYVAHHKGFGWFLAFAGATAGLTAAVYFFTRDVFSTSVVAVMALVFGAFAARKPRELNYVIDEQGVHIAQRTYAYSNLKSFSVVEEGSIRSVVLNPMQRFALPISIYCEPGDEGKIFDVLSSYIPYEDHANDAMDKLMRKIRF